VSRDGLTVVSRGVARACSGRVFAEVGARTRNDRTPGVAISLAMTRHCPSVAGYGGRQGLPEAWP